MMKDMEKMEMGETPEEEVKHHSKGFLEKAAHLKEGGKKASAKSYGKHHGGKKKVGAFGKGGFGKSGGGK